MVFILIRNYFSWVIRTASKKLVCEDYANAKETIEIIPARNSKTVAFLVYKNLERAGWILSNYLKNMVLRQQINQEKCLAQRNCFWCSKFKMIGFPLSARHCNILSTSQHQRWRKAAAEHSLNCPCTIDPGSVFFGMNTKTLIVLWFMWYVIISWFISCSDSCPNVRSVLLLLSKKQLQRYLCLLVWCFSSPYRKQTLNGSAATWSCTQECFSSTPPPPKKEHFFNCIKVGWGPCPHSPLCWGSTLTFGPFLQWKASARMFLFPALEQGKSSFLLIGNLSAGMLHPRFLPPPACPLWALRPFCWVQDALGSAWSSHA